MAEFASTVEIQQEFKLRNAQLPPHRRMECRIGLNVGDVIVEGERIYGDGVNIAARLEGLAEGGGICIAGTVYDQVEGKLPVQYISLGRQSVKNISQCECIASHWRPAGLLPTALQREKGYALIGGKRHPFLTHLY